MSFSPLEQSPAGDQDQQVTPAPTQAAPPPAPVAPPAAPAPAAPAPGSAPWASDLNSVFTDDTTRGLADNFLREKVQPYITQLEQKAAGNTDAQRLYDAFANEPLDAYVAVTEELFGADVAQQLLGQIQQNLETQQPQNQAPQAGPTADPQTQELLSWVEEQRLNQLYDQQLASLSNDPQYADVVPDALHPFVAASGGDFNQAVEMYRSYVTQFGQPQVAAPPTEQPVEQQPAAAVLGSDADAQPGSTPVEPRKQTLDQAIEEFVRESKQNPAPPVGSV